MDLSFGEVVRRAAPKQAPNIPVDQVMAAIAKELSFPGVVAAQYGDTVFIAHATTKPGVYFFRALNADTPLEYMRNVLKFFAQMFQAGIRVLVTEFDDPSIINIAKGIRVYMDEANDIQYAIQRKLSGRYRMTVYLGDGFMSSLGGII